MIRLGLDDLVSVLAIEADSIRLPPVGKRPEEESSPCGNYGNREKGYDLFSPVRKGLCRKPRCGGIS